MVEVLALAASRPHPPPALSDRPFFTLSPYLCMSPLVHSRNHSCTHMHTVALPHALSRTPLALVRVCDLSVGGRTTTVAEEQARKGSVIDKQTHSMPFTCV